MAICKLGDKVKDPISGFEGIVTGYTHYAFNCDRVLVRPQALNKDGKPMEGEWFDAPPLELLATNVMPAWETVPMPFNMGDEVMDTVSKFKGIITGYTQYIAGCTRAMVQPVGVKDGKIADELYFAVAQLTLIKAAKPAKKAEKEKPGGPMRSPLGVRDPK